MDLVQPYWIKTESNMDQWLRDDERDSFYWNRCSENVDAGEVGRFRKSLDMRLTDFSLGTGLGYIHESGGCIFYAIEDVENS